MVFRLCIEKQLILSCVALVTVLGFAPPEVVVLNRLSYQQNAILSPRARPLSVVADPPMEKERRRRKEDDDESNDAWIISGSGFIPNIKSRIKSGLASRQTPSKVVEVKDIQKYKEVVVDEDQSIVCVRFYAPWCSACRAVQLPFRRLGKEFPSVKFVEVPLTRDNAFLHQGLGIPSLPYGHIYHPKAGLVEERKINKNVFSDFKQALKTYVDGECSVDYDETGELNFQM